MQFPRRRRAFTLVEMLLIFVVLLATFAIAWPSLNRLYQDHQLKQGAELVQVRLASARVHAVDSGMTYQFRYEPGGHKFLIVPFEAETSVESTSNGSETTQSANWKYVGQVSDYVVFDQSAAGSTGLQQLPATWLSGVPDAETYQNVSWSQPLLFHPDGSSSGGIVDLLDPRDQYIRLSVRTLTGGVTASKVEQGGSL